MRYVRGLKGPVGAGQVTKMINHVLCLTLYPILAEALKLGENAGVRRSRRLETSSKRSPDPGSAAPENTVDELPESKPRSGREEWPKDVHRERSTPPVGEGAVRIEGLNPVVVAIRDKERSRSGEGGIRGIIELRPTSCAATSFSRNKRQNRLESTRTGGLVQRRRRPYLRAWPWTCLKTQTSSPDWRPMK